MSADQTACGIIGESPTVSELGRRGPRRRLEDDVSCVQAFHIRTPRPRRRYDLSLLARYGREVWSSRATDQSIERELKEALTWAGSCTFSAVDVRVREGTVFLTGEVTDFDSFRSLDDLVTVTPGVRYVKNGVLVIPEEEHEPPVWVGER